MPTYAFYDDATAGSALPHEARRHDVVLKKQMKTSDIIATNAVLTAAGKIAAADIIQAIQIPEELVVEKGVVKITTAEGGTLTVDVGLAGGDELFDGINLNQATGTRIITLVGDDWGANNVMGKAMTADDTLDVTYNNDTDTVDYLLYVKGFLLW